MEVAGTEVVDVDVDVVLVSEVDVDVASVVEVVAGWVVDEAVVEESTVVVVVVVCSCTAVVGEVGVAGGCVVADGGSTSVVVADFDVCSWPLAGLTPIPPLEGSSLALKLRSGAEPSDSSWGTRTISGSRCSEANPVR